MTALPTSQVLVASTLVHNVVAGGATHDHESVAMPSIQGIAAAVHADGQFPFAVTILSGQATVAAAVTCVDGTVVADMYLYTVTAARGRRG